MDNTGPYLSYAELLIEMALGGSTLVLSSDIVLSNKLNDPGGDIFEYSGAGIPVVGDVVSQLGKGSTVIELLTGPTRLRVEDADGSSPLANGAARLFHSDSVPRYRGEGFIQEAMGLIDEVTGQFFNARSATVTLEGNNTPTLWLPVPIISITQLLINSTSLELQEGEDYDFVAFKGRERPQDDRRNPRIKLNVGRGRDSIFTGAITNRVFIKETLTHITGTFGFLEPDGSTPALIKKATAILALGSANVPIATSAGGTTGPLKRTKVDLHEQEFFENKVTTSKSSITGDAQVDYILAKYRAPIRISGAIELTSAVVDKSRGGSTW